MKCLALAAIIIFGLAQQPAKAPAPVKTDTPVQNKNESVTHPEQGMNNEELTVQRELAWFTGALVVVGFLQLIALFRQARIMGQHRASLEQLSKAATDNAEPATKNADAYYLNAKILIEAKRPQVAMEAHGNPIKELLSETPRVQIELVNRGSIPAHDCHYESWIELISFPFKGFHSVCRLFQIHDNLRRPYVEYLP
jgi:hypothetical protein